MEQRTTHDVKEVNRGLLLKDVKTIITFRTQQLLDLWVNEMSGQISDGMWENSRNTEWIWSNVLVRLGDKTEVTVRPTFGGARRTHYPLTAELWNVVGDRILAENGFASKKEAYAAWREIAEAIRNFKTFSDEDAKMVVDSQKEIESQKRVLRAELFKEGAEVLGVDSYGNLNSLSIYDENKKWVGSIYCYTYVSDNLSACWKIQLLDKLNFIAGLGHLAEALEFAKDAALKMRKFSDGMGRVGC